jgi:hypothetical protein
MPYSLGEFCSLAGNRTTQLRRNGFAVIGVRETALRREAGQRQNGRRGISVSLKELRTYSLRTSKIKEGGAEGEAGRNQQEEGGGKTKRETIKVQRRSENNNTDGN